MGVVATTLGECLASDEADDKAKIDPKDEGSTDSKKKANGFIMLGKYRVDMSDDGFLGAGSFSTCHKGVIISSNAPVAIKTYKKPAKSSAGGANQLMKFKRQIHVLQDLLKPFEVPEDPKLWNAQLEKASPAKLFMNLVDFSKDSNGEPAPDPRQGLLLVTELAGYSMKDYLATLRGEHRRNSRQTIRNITKAIVLVMAGLHAKGLVHLDMKPENLMVFNGQMKLIDVDGCVKVGSIIKVTDPSISFSPCYCAPEWAHFLIEESLDTIIADPCLDVWSVGCTICELVTLDAILKPMYANMVRHSHSHKKAGFLFLDWLSNIKKPPVPKEVEQHDPELARMIRESMLVCNKADRKSCAQILGEAYVSEVAFHRSSTNPLVEIDGVGDGVDLVISGVEMRARVRAEDTNSKPRYQGVLWKLNQGKDMRDGKQWLQRDMYVTNLGKLCYFSHKENKRLVLIDAHKMHGAKIEPVKGAFHTNAFSITPIEHGHQEGADDTKFVFAGESEAATQEWLTILEETSHMDAMPTFNLGDSFNQERVQYHISVKNRRMKVTGGSEQGFEPVFKANLWKVKTAGDPMQDADWFLRETWISRNGSLVYWSVKQGCELVYYTCEDIAQATVRTNEGSSKPFSFQVILPVVDGIEFDPGDFAAESAEMRDQWIAEFAKFTS